MADAPLNPQKFKQKVAERFFYEDEFFIEMGYSFENAVSWKLASPFILMVLVLVSFRSGG